MISKGTRDNRRVDEWTEAETLHGKLYRYVDTGVDLPLIEIFERDLPRLDGYEFYEPYRVVAQPPTLFAIYDREERLIYGPEGLASDYSIERLVQADGFASVEEFQNEFARTKSQVPVTDIDFWVRLGLPAKVFLPSLNRKH